MKIQTYKEVQHDGVNIYVRRLGTTFEYLFAKAGNIYTETVKMRPGLMRSLLSPLGLMKKYSDIQIVGIVRHMQALAFNKVEELKKPKQK